MHDAPFTSYLTQCWLPPESGRHSEMSRTERMERAAPRAVACRSTVTAFDASGQVLGQDSRVNLDRPTGLSLNAPRRRGALSRQRSGGWFEKRNF
jgi:hypothetical protein